MSEVLQPGRTYHVAFAKRYLVKQIRKYGPAVWLEGFTGSIAEAVAEIEADPREVFALCDCEHDDRGYCLGFEPHL
jgi:hypothetical protein